MDSIPVQSHIFNFVSSLERYSCGIRKRPRGSAARAGVIAIKLGVDHSPSKPHESLYEDDAHNEKYRGVLKFLRVSQGQVTSA